MTTPLAIRTALWLWLIAALLAGRLPLNLRPAFLVPLILATHVLIFVRLRRTVMGGV